MEAPLARIMLAGTASGCGKTTLTCALLRLLSRRGLRLRAYKCGPDYLDPSFHRQVLGLPSHNLDLFLGSEALARALMAEGGREADLSLIEGVMGYYDGVASSDAASSYALARATQTPVLLLADARGRSLSLAAELAGFARFRRPSQIAGIILNRASDASYPRLKELLERELGLPVLGYLPPLAGAVLESRHLGLVDAAELPHLQEQLDLMADALESRLDLDALLRLARQAPPLYFQPRSYPAPVTPAPTIAVARDEAFSFYYEESLELLQRLGARLAFFSPLRDGQLPQGSAGLYLGGGYPELHAQELSENMALRAAIAEAISAGMPTIAECGGFLYLHERLQDEQGRAWPMVGALQGLASKGERLGPFGYVTLTAQVDGLLAPRGACLPAHEFHYWRSSREDGAFEAAKPQSGRSWPCGVESQSLYAAFPHLYLCGCPEAAKRFVDACAAFTAGKGGRP